MEIDYDYLRTGTAMGFCASHELCSNYLLILPAAGSHSVDGIRSDMNVLILAVKM